MLYLKPPFHIIEGVSVFADHANERQFYYLPAMPRLNSIEDPVTGQDAPELQLLKFRGDAGSGGFLSFGVNLGVDQDRLDAVALQLKQLHRLRDQPILAPVILETGTVRLMILGEETPEPADGGQPTTDDDDAAEPRFVVKIAHPAKPALYGDNQAIFSVELDADGVQLVEESLQGELMPIGIVYSLTFLALRPAFSVRVHADWDRVQHHFQESFGFDVLFSSVQIDEVIDELIENQIVTIEIDTFLPEGEENGSFIGRRDQAISDFKDMVLETFFEPSLEPVREEEDGWDKVVHTAERLSLLAATSGWAGAGKFSYKQIDITRIDKKTVNLTMNERVTVRRSIYPQAHLKGLSRFLRDPAGPIDLSRFVREVTLGHDWFKKRAVKAHALVNFAHDQVDSINATLSYADRPQTLRLTATESSGSKDWNSIVETGTMKREVEYEYRVNFKDVDTTERPGIIQSPRMTTIGDEFEVAPRAEGLYYVDDVQISADGLPWELYPTIEVHVRYDDPANQIDLADTFILNQSKPEATWQRFRLDRELDGYEIRIIYRAANHRDIVVDWTPTTEERFVIRNPRPLKRAVQVVPAVSWGLVSMVFVELSYRDDANGIFEQQTLSFFDTEADRNPKTFTVDLLDPDQRFVTYSAMLLLSDNRQVAIPPSVTAGTVVFVRADMMGHRIITVRPDEVDFAAKGIMRIEADLTYADRDEGLSFEDSFTFNTSADRDFFEFDYLRAERNSYTCKARILLSNGLIQAKDLGSLTGDTVIIPTI